MAKLKLTPELEEEILNLIRAGNYAKDACLAVGIDESTYYRWLRTGEKAKSGKLYQFYQSIQKARAFARAHKLEKVNDAIDDGNWQAAAWWLERTDPEHWGRRSRVDLEGQVDSNVKGEVEHKGKVKAVLPDGISEEVVAEFGLFIAKRGATGSAEDSESEDDREV
ncbi:MAG: hypothetical protein ACOX08_11700 [Methanobacterium sp.]|jgi:transposase